MTTESQETTGPIKTIKLDHPYNHGTKKITECIIERRPKAKHMRKVNLQAMDVDDTMKILSNITNLSFPEFEEMDFDDLSVLGVELRNLLPNTLRIGKGD